MICVDASVAAKWIFGEDRSAQAEDLYHHAASRSERIVAPVLLPIEMTNLVRQRMRQGRPAGSQPLSLPEARQLLECFLGLPIDLTTPPGLHHQALEIAAAYNLPAAYDAHYVALAEMLGADLWTDDQRLLRAVEGKLGFVKWIGEYRPSQP